MQAIITQTEGGELRTVAKIAVLPVCPRPEDPPPTRTSF